ncbi:MAG: helix-turn-helix domain-containing protein [Clostridia bacterium]|nr:helix-turn-helix domain-containing protein [Clostridia bacterium]
MKEFAERLKDLRLEKGLSQRELAKLVNLSHTAILRWENQTRIPNGEAIVALAKFFGVTTDYLLGLTD